MSRNGENNKGGAPEGNTNSCKENRLWTNTLRRAVAQGNGNTLRKLAKKLIDKALGGDLQAIKEIGNRLDGRPAQAIQAEVDATHVYVQTIYGDPEKATKPMDTT